MAIPIVLIQNGEESQLRLSLECDSSITVNQVITAPEDRNLVTASCQELGDFVIINVENMSRELAVCVALSLRNSNRQVFMAIASDYEDLRELMSDVSRFIEGSHGIDIQREVLVTEGAMATLGDITALVKLFEAEFLVD